MPIPPPKTLKLFEDWAEDTFQHSGSGSGVTINPSRRDRRGWDFIAEWDVEPEPGLPIDRQTLGRSARVQVKSSRQPKPTARLKLSNALRFAEAVEPCFIVVYWLNKQKTAVEIFVRHFDDALIERTLKRAREADRDGETDKHKITLLVQMEPSDLHSNDLLEWIQTSCTDKPSDYAQRKTQFVDKVGYERTSVAGFLKVRRSQLNAFVEHAVGLNPEFKPEWLDLRDTRFGIPASVPLFAGVPESFNMVTTPKRAAFRATAEDGRKATIPGEARRFRVPGHHTSDMLTGSFVSPYLDARIFSNNRINIDYRFKAGEVADARLLAEVLELLTMLDDGPVNAALKVEGKMLEVGTFSTSEKNDRSGFLGWGLATLKHLLLAVKKREKISLCLNDLIDAGDDLEHFALCVSPTTATLRLIPKISNPRDVEAVALLGYAYVQVGEHAFAILYEQPLISTEFDGDTIVLTFGHPVHLNRWAKKQSVAQLLPKVQKRFGERLKASPAGTVYVDGGDLVSGMRGAQTVMITGPKGMMLTHD